MMTHSCKNSLDVHERKTNFVIEYKCLSHIMCQIVLQIPSTSKCFICETVSVS